MNKSMEIGRTEKQETNVIKDQLSNKLQKTFTVAVATNVDYCRPGS